MFKFNELRQIHLEITNNCQASCPMCNRNINGGLDNPLIKIKNWSLGDFKNIMTNEVLTQIDNYYFCSNFGDPMMNNDLIKMCEYSVSVAPDVTFSIHTNGGARTTAWWEQLAEVLPNTSSVVFALDGLSDTHHLYRVGTKFETVLNNAISFIQAGGTAEWVFIRFRHNEHQVEQAEALSKKHGFKKFTLKNSSRFILEPKISVLNRNGDLTHYIEPASDTPLQFINSTIINNYKEIVNKSVINCKSKINKEIYIDAYKNLYPCCWIASVPYSYIYPDEAADVRTEMLKQHNDLMARIPNINTLNNTIEQIINSNEYQTVWEELWNDKQLITCARTCGISDVKFAQPKDQIITRNIKHD